MTRRMRYGSAQSSRQKGHGPRVVNQVRRAHTPSASGVANEGGRCLQNGHVSCRHPSRKPVHRFSVNNTYHCRLHPVRCGAHKQQRRCNVWTAIRPLCAPCADLRLGLAVRPSLVGGCGLFATTLLLAFPRARLYTMERYTRRSVLATRTFRKDDLVCPYLGAKRSIDEWRCPQSQGDAISSGYALEVKTRDGRVWQMDTSCHRSYGAMVNHAPEGRANVSFVMLDRFSLAHLTTSDEPGRHAVRYPTSRIRTAPSVL